MLLPTENNRLSDAALSRYRDVARSILGSLGGFSNEESLAVLELVRAEFLLQVAQNSRVIHQSGEQNRHEHVFDKAGISDCFARNP